MRLIPGIQRYKLSVVDGIFILLSVAIFIYLISIPAIYSPATNSYWHVNINRYPVYVLFIRTVHLIFGSNYYDLAIVGIQLLFGLVSVHVFFKNVSSLLKLNIILKGVLFLLLVFPFFQPLYTANNICSEGLSYPLYLLLISFSIDFLFRSQNKRIYLLIPAYILLVLTRGQFSILIPILILLFLIKYKKDVFKKRKRYIPFSIGYHTICSEYAGQHLSENSSRSLYNNTFQLYQRNYFTLVCFRKKGQCAFSE